MVESTDPLVIAKTALDQSALALEECGKILRGVGLSATASLAAHHAMLAREAAAIVAPAIHHSEPGAGS